MFQTAHKEFSVKSAKVSELKDDLSGPGSGVKWFNIEDHDGNQVLLVKAQVTESVCQALAG
jgi:hypothetical protein